MNVTEARELTQKTNALNTLPELYNRIKESAEKGLSFILIDYHISQPVINSLKSEGYIVDRLSSPVAPIRTAVIRIAW